jgi:hypothetical protein
LSPVVDLSQVRSPNIAASVVSCDADGQQTPDIPTHRSSSAKAPTRVGFPFPPAVLSQARGRPGRAVLGWPAGACCWRHQQPKHGLHTPPELRGAFGVPGGGAWVPMSQRGSALLKFAPRCQREGRGKTNLALQFPSCPLDAAPALRDGAHSVLSGNPRTECRVNAILTDPLKPRDQKLRGTEDLQPQPIFPFTK